jgi:hypothetical protein
MRDLKKTNQLCAIKISTDDDSLGNPNESKHHIVRSNSFWDKFDIFAIAMSVTVIFIAINRNKQ